MFATLLLTFALFALVMLVMAIGLFFRRPCLRGSCGGPEVLGPDGEPLTCDTCPRRKERETPGWQGQATDELTSITP